MQDEMILDLFFARDEKAISETEIKYGRGLMGLSINIVGDVEDAKECVSDTYLAAWNTIPPNRPQYFYAYLCKVVRNISYNLFNRNIAQKRNANMVALSDELLEILPNQEGDSKDDIFLGEAIDEFIRLLDIDTKLLFIRRYFYGETINKLAKMSNLSENNISVRLHRTRRKLKKFLEKEGFLIWTAQSGMDSKILVMI